MTSGVPQATCPNFRPTAIITAQNISTTPPLSRDPYISAHISPHTIAYLRRLLQQQQQQASSSGHTVDHPSFPPQYWYVRAAPAAAAASAATAAPVRRDGSGAADAVSTKRYVVAAASSTERATPYISTLGPNSHIASSTTSIFTMFNVCAEPKFIETTHQSFGKYRR